MSNGRLGILVGGGPAPGINGVIAAATIEGINNGFEVIGFRDGFKYLAQGDPHQCKPLTIRDVSAIHLKGGSILGTARTNPTKSEEQMKNVFAAFRKNRHHQPGDDRRRRHGIFRQRRGQAEQGQDQGGARAQDD